MHVKGGKICINMPEPRGIGFKMRGGKDTDYAFESVTPKSRKISLICFNNVPIDWKSKNHSSVKCISFRS